VTGVGVSADALLRQEDFLILRAREARVSKDEEIRSSLTIQKRPAVADAAHPSRRPFGPPQDEARGCGADS
jgi:hypothetical protein